MSVLYLCYQSILEPLTQTQVFAYLEGLAESGYRIILLTFEPRALTQGETKIWQERLSRKSIVWHSLRYHKRPTVPATAWDILTGILIGLWLMKKYQVKLLHARIHVPGIMALVLKGLTGAKFLFDLRGFMAEEYADAGIWRAGSPLFRLTKRAERAIVNAADGIIVLTNQARALLQQWYPSELSKKPIQVIPCCVDLRLYAPDPPTSPLPALCITLVYVGKLGGWYPVPEMVAFVQAAAATIPNLRWKIWTQSDPTAMWQQINAQGLTDRVTIGVATSQELAIEVAAADAGLAFYKRTLSAAGCSPTKVGEYLAAGLPVISTAGIGDLDELLTGTGAPVGVLLTDFSDTSYRAAASELSKLLQDPHLRERCRTRAREHLDLEQVGWVRYRQMYTALLPLAAAAPNLTLHETA